MLIPNEPTKTGIIIYSELPEQITFLKILITKFFIGLLHIFQPLKLFSHYTYLIY